MSNPFRPVYTPDQDRRVRDGRKQLLTKWRCPRFAQGQGRAFGVDFTTEEIDADGQLVDVFTARDASASFTQPWKDDVQQNAFTVEHGARQFEIRVPHHTYLNSRFLPLSVDRDCCLATTFHIILIAILIYCAIVIRIT